MNEWDRLHKMSKLYKEMYPKGTRVEVISMENDPRPIMPGTMGTVVVVDDMCTIHCEFDNGRRLGLIPGEDQFKIIKEG